MKNATFESLGIKTTKHSLAIYDYLRKKDFPVTAKEIFSSLRKSGIDLSTIYRTLKTFQDCGLVKKEVNEKKENVFSLVKDEDNHILVCTKCHKRVLLHGCPYHEVNEQIEKETGFLVNDQNTEIYGLCPDCKKKLKRK